MSALDQVPAPRRWLQSIGASLALTFLVGGVVVRTASADGVGDQQQKVQQIADQLDGIQNKIDQLDDDYNAALDRQDQLNTDIAAAKAKVDAQQAQLDQLQGTLGQIAVDKYTSGSDTSLSPVFTDAATYSDAQQRDELNRLSIDNGAGDVDEASALATQLAKDKAALESKEKQAADVVTTLQSKKDQATQLEAQYEDDYTTAKATLGDLIQQEEDRRAAAAVAQAQAIAAQQAAADKAKADAAAAASAAAAAAAKAAATAPKGNHDATSPATPPSTPANPATTASTPRGGGSDNSGAAASDNSGGNNGTAAGNAQSGSGDTGSTAPSDSTPSPPPPSSRAGVAIAAAESQLGVPYRFAAESPGVAFDCSGLTKYAWGQAGVNLPHQSAQQYASTPHVTRDQIQPGDLLYYHTPIGHVAIYIGNNELIHAPRTGDVVKIAAVNWAAVVGISRPG
jgi:cell wall-associated NlpC family hydrolase